MRAKPRHCWTNRSGAGWSCSNIQITALTSHLSWLSKIGCFSRVMRVILWLRYLCWQWSGLFFCLHGLSVCFRESQEIQRGVFIYVLITKTENIGAGGTFEIFHHSDRVNYVLLDISTISVGILIISIQYTILDFSHLPPQPAWKLLVATFRY